MPKCRTVLNGLSLWLCASSVSAQASISDGVRPSAPTPELFGEGIFSTGRYELPPTFTPDGETAYFTVSTPVYGRLHVIMETHLENGRWSAPQVASFSGQYGDADPLISPDGSRLFFISKRPLISGGEPRNDFDIFYVEPESDGWGEPVHVAAASGSGAEYYASAVADGTLYIAAVRPDSQGRGDIYRVPLIDGKYREPENLGPAINSPDHHDTTPYVAPDESYLIFSSWARQDGLGSGDLYISFRQDDGTWSPARNLGPEVNSARTEYCPIVSPDGEYLYFASDRGLADRSPSRPMTTEEWTRMIDSAGNGLGDTYRVPMRRVLNAVAGRP